MLWCFYTCGLLFCSLYMHCKWHCCKQWPALSRTSLFYQKRLCPFKIIFCQTLHSTRVESPDNKRCGVWPDSELPFGRLWLSRSEGHWFNPSLQVEVLYPWASYYVNDWSYWLPTVWDATSGRECDLYWSELKQVFIYHSVHSAIKASTERNGFTLTWTNKNSRSTSTNFSLWAHLIGQVHCYPPLSKLLNK